MAKHRNKSNTDFAGCKGRMEGYFGNDGYWFRIKQCHTCDKEGGTAHARDHPPKNTDDLTGTKLAYYQR